MLVILKIVKLDPFVKIVFKSRPKHILNIAQPRIIYDFLSIVSFVKIRQLKK